MYPFGKADRIRQNPVGKTDKFLRFPIVKTDKSAYNTYGKTDTEESVMISRDMDKKLERFFAADEKRALLITGARQVGKTFTIREFG